MLLSLIPWWGRLLAVAAVLVGAAAFGAVKMHEHDEAAYDAQEAKFEAFQDQVRAAGIEAQAKAKVQALADQERKQRADKENSDALATLAAAVGRMRDFRPASSFVPAAPSTSSRPDLLCFDRAEYQRADGIFTEGARGLAGEGSKATVNLDSAKRWAQH